MVLQVAIAEIVLIAICKQSKLTECGRQDRLFDKFVQATTRRKFSAERAVHRKNLIDRVYYTLIQHAKVFKMTCRTQSKARENERLESATGKVQTIYKAQ